MLLRRMSAGPALWLLAGLLVGLAMLTMASVGLVILPVFLPLIVFVYLLIEYRVPGLAMAAVGAIVAIDVFATWLVVNPPCAAPLITRAGDGSLLIGCAAEEDLAPLLVGAVVASALIGALLWANQRRRVGRSEETDSTTVDVSQS